MIQLPHQTGSLVPRALSTSSRDFALTAGGGRGAIFSFERDMSRSPEKTLLRLGGAVDVGGVGGQGKINLLKRKACVLSHSLGEDDDNVIVESLLDIFDHMSADPLGGDATGCFTDTDTDLEGGGTSGCRNPVPLTGPFSHSYSLPMGAWRGGRGYRTGPFTRTSCALPGRQETGGHVASVSYGRQVEGTGAGGIGHRPDCQRTPDSFQRRHNTPIPESCRRHFKQGSRHELWIWN